MLSEETMAIREDMGVTRLYPARTRDRSEPVTDALGPSHAFSPGARGLAFFSELGARLDEAFEHRLLEPFTRIRTMTTVLKDDPSAERADQANTILRAAEQAEGMLRNILDFIRSAASGMNIARRRIDLRRLCERVVDAIHNEHPDRPMVFASDPRVEGEWDPERLEALLSKLVLNAIEHGPPRPAIRIELRGLPDHAVLQVWNAGAILDVDVLRALFEPFASGRGRQRDGAEGLGMGLFLAREIARAHLGHIDVESTETAGTTFRVTLPRS
jgi:signal transduction histidine kinase